LCQAIFSKHKAIDKARAAVIASYKITAVLAKRKKLLKCGNVNKECVIVACDAVFNELKKMLYAMQFTRPSYLEVLPQMEWDVCPMTVKN
jgi:hypothetical protein